MAMIEPKAGKAFERDPEEGNYPTGMYVCELSRVQQIGPSAKYPDGNDRLVFEFTVADPNYPQYAGKKCAAFVGMTFMKTKDGRESNLVKMLRLMGVPNPEKGFDPDHLIGRKFQVMSEHSDGRSWCRSAMAIPGGPPVPPPAAPQQFAPPPPREGPPEVEAGRLALMNAGNEDELKAAWEKLPGWVQKALVDVRNKQRDAINAPTPSAHGTLPEQMAQIPW